MAANTNIERPAGRRDATRREAKRRDGQLYSRVGGNTGQGDCGSLLQPLGVGTSGVEDVSKFSLDWRRRVDVSSGEEAATAAAAAAAVAAAAAARIAYGPAAVGRFAAMKKRTARCGDDKRMERMERTQPSEFGNAKVGGMT